LVLEGSQGDGKTSAFRKLGGDWYSDATQDDLANKEAAIKLQAAWIFVFDENAISKRADAVRMKEFLTKLYDEYVPKFSNIKRKQPRQNAFAITTNDSEYLSDVTGNRRYLPMRVGSIDLEALERDRDHFWAEALHRYNAGEQFWPTEEQEAILAVEQEKRRKPDPWEPTIAEYIDDKGEVTIEEILVKALDIKPKEGDKLDRARVSACLQVMGWKQAEKMKRVYGIPSRYYVPSEPAEIARKADVAKLLVEAAAALEDV
jgi:predicted P-loop ATPase